MPDLLIRLCASRKHLRVAELNEYPEKVPLATYASPKNEDPLRIRRQASRRVQSLPWPPDSPATPTVDVQSGYWPGSGRVSTLRASFVRTHQVTPHPAEYPSGDAPAQPDIAALTPARETPKWPEVGQHLQQVFLGVFRETDQRYYSGWALAFERAPRAFRTSFKRKLQRLSPPEEFPATPTTTAVYPAYVPPKRHFRQDHRKVIRLPQLDEYPRTIQSPAAYAPVKQHKRRETARIIRFPLQLDERPQTPAVPEQPPTSFQMPVQHRRKGWSNIVLLAEYPDRQEAVFPTSREAVTHVWYWDRFRHKKGA